MLVVLVEYTADGYCCCCDENCCGDGLGGGCRGLKVSIEILSPRSAPEGCGVGGG